MATTEEMLVAEVNKEVKGLRDVWLETNNELRALLNEQKEEISRVGGTSGELSARISIKEAEYEKQLADLEGKGTELESRFQEFKQFMEQAEAEQKKIKRSHEMKTVRSVLTCEEAESFRNWDPDRGGGISSPQLHFKSFEDLVREDGRESKTITGGDALRSVLSANLVQTIRGLPRLRTQHIRDHLTVESLPGVGRVEYIVETGYTNNAEFQSAEGAAKALSALTYEAKTANPKTIAHGIPISRQLAKHVPALVRRIEDRLIDGLYHVEDVKILFADGTSGSFEGITQTTGIQEFENHPAVVAGETAEDTMIDTIRRSITMIEDLFLTADLVVLNNYDWEKIELTKDSQGRYIWVTVQQGGTPILWRLPVFSTNAMTAGDFLTGSFRSSATLWETEKAFIQLFTQHSDWALKNQLLLLAEMEEAFTVEIPEGFVYGNFVTALGS
jgi:HK97 family phage major capsid protein